MKKITELIKNIFIENPTPEHDFYLSSSNITTQNDNVNYENVFENLSINLEYLKMIYTPNINNDIIFREFTMTYQDKKYNSFLLFIDGMVDSKRINEFVLKPLMILAKRERCTSQSTAIANNISIKRVSNTPLDKIITNYLLPQNDLKKYSKFKDIINDVNSGNCILFIDTIPLAFSLDVKGFKHRNVSEPQNEIVVRGSQEAFVEVQKVNTSIIRRLVNNENLIIENKSIGTLSKTKVSICYMKNIANDSLVNEVKYRLNNINVDSIISSGQLEQLIQDKSNTSFPQLISTERPDKVVNFIYEGRVAIVINGSPYVLVAPGVLVDFLSSPEDLNLKYQFSNILRFIRIIAMLLALLLPSMYIAITTYHPEFIPTELLFAIAASRASVPFPIIFEIVIMEGSFELIREAGLRVPSPIGPTIGIVGALILGEAAVSASIVSPILIIIVSITAICSFAVPDYSLSFTLRFLRFLFLFLGYIAGFLGIAIGLFIYATILNNLKSFGVPYLSPYIPNGNRDSETSIFLKPVWLREHRANFLKTKKILSANHISMKWKQ